MRKDTDIIDKACEIPRGIGGYHHDIVQEMIAEIERLRAERDEARRMWCEAEAVGNCLSVDDMKRRARTEAKRREWDCFKMEDGK
jgi:hypothetical protein